MTPLPQHLLALLTALSVVVSAKTTCNKMVFEEYEEGYIGNKMSFTLGEYEQKGQDAYGVPYFIHYISPAEMLSDGRFVDKMFLYHRPGVWEISDENKNEDGNTIWWQVHEYNDDDRRKLDGCYEGCATCDGPDQHDCGSCLDGSDPVDDDGDGYGSCDDHDDHDHDDHDHDHDHDDETNNHEFLWPTAVKGDWSFYDKDADVWRVDDVARMRCVASKKSDDEFISEVELPFFIATVILVFVGLVFAVMAIVGTIRKKSDMRIQKSHVREADAEAEAGGGGSSGGGDGGGGKF